MIRRLAAILVTAALGCGQDSPRSARAQRVCELLGQRLAARMQAHEADREAFRDAARSDDSGLAAERSLVMAPRIGDFVATHEVAVQFGAGCTDPDRAPCRGIGAPVLLAHLDDAYRAMEALSRGFAGQGPCAPSGGVHTTPCEAIRATLIASARGLASSMAALPPSLDAQGLVAHESLRAIRAVSRWRAELDYALAAAPACLPVKTTESCAGLRQGLANAQPDDLARRVTVLSDAYATKQPCKPADLP